MSRPRSSQLEDRGRFMSAVARAPFDDALRLVWADEQLDLGEPRAEAISLDNALPGLEVEQQGLARARLASLTEQHGAQWAPDLAPFLDLPRCIFRLGFLDTAVISWRAPARALRSVAASPDWRTVRRVFFNGSAPSLDPAGRKSPEAVTQLELLRRLPWLTGVGGLLPNVFLAMGPHAPLTALHLRLEAPPSGALLARLSTFPALRRLALREPKWAPPQQMAPMWRPLTPPGLELLCLECLGRAPGWLKLAKGLPTPRFAVQTPELGNAWLVTRQVRGGLAVDLWIPDAGYLAERCLAVLEDLPTPEITSLQVWTPGVLHDAHAARLTQAMARFGKAETAVLTGRLRVHPVFD